MYEPTFLCPIFFFPPIIPDSILPIRMANPSTLLSSHHFPKNFALWLPILSPALFTFSPPTGSFSHSHYCLLSKPTKHDPVTCSPSQPNFLKELSIHFVFTSHLPVPSQATPPPARQMWAFSGFKPRCPLLYSVQLKNK